MPVLEVDSEISMAALELHWALEDFDKGVTERTRELVERAFARLTAEGAVFDPDVVRRGPDVWLADPDEDAS